MCFKIYSAQTSLIFCNISGKYLRFNVESKYLLDIVVNLAIIYFCFYFNIILVQLLINICVQSQMSTPRSKLFQSVKKSVSYLTSSTSSMSTDEPISEESYAFLEKCCSGKKLLSVSIQKVTKVNDPLNASNTFASYQISVLTDDIYYKVGKRYTEFKKLFDTVCKYHSLQITFPRKTFWYSGTADCVTMQRQQQLNDFLLKMHKEIEQPNIGIPFLKFLQLQENYCLRGLTLEKMISKNKCLNGNISQHLLLQMHKLNANSQNILGVLRQFQKCLIINKARIQSVTAKNIINGSSDNMGIVQIIFRSQNQVIVLEGFTLLINLLNIETNILSERYKILYQAVPFSFFKELSVEVLKNGKIKNMFFELITLYVEGKAQQQLTVNEIFKQKKQYLKEFKIWNKNLKQKSLSYQSFSSQSTKSIKSPHFDLQKSHQHKHKFEKMQQIQKEQSFFYTPNLSKSQITSYQILYEKRVSENQFAVQLISNDDHFIQIHSQTRQPFQNLKDKLLSLEWCKIFQNVKNPQDNDGIYCQLKNIDRSYRNLKFIVQTCDYLNKTKILFKPVKQIIGGIILYIKIQLMKSKIEDICQLRIIFYLASSKARKFFTQEVRNTLMESAIQAFLLSDQ